MLTGIHWLGHASFRIEYGGLVVYIDPWKIQHPIPADIILITHDHHDHLSPNDVDKLLQPKTIVVRAGKEVAGLNGDVRVVKPGETLQLGMAKVVTVPAYSVGKAFHPRQNNFVGYVLTLADMTIYFAGDTDLIPEMSEIHCDVALLPIGGKYTMDPSEAAQAAAIIKPKYVVPMHYGDIIGNDESAQRFQDLVPKGIQVIRLKPE